MHARLSLATLVAICISSFASAPACAQSSSMPAQGAWSARFESLDLYTQTNPGRASARAPSSARSSSGGLQAHAHYGWFYTTESWRHGAGGIYLDGVARADGEPGLSLFSPALAAEWNGAFHRHGDALHLGYYAEAEERHDSYSLHLRDGWTTGGAASLNWSWNGSLDKNWQGYADNRFFNVVLGGEFQRHDSTASTAAQRAVFDGTWEDAFLGFSGRLVAHDSMSPLRLIKGLSVVGTFRDGDFVSTGPATADVVAAAHAAVEDGSLGNETPPNDSYRLRARSLILDVRVRIARAVLIGWTHENDTARAGFKATNDYFYLRVD